jgi:transketolase
MRGWPSELYPHGRTIIRTITMPRASLDDLCINTIRTLSIDAVQQAKSGHPGTPMAMAPVVYTVWQRFLRFDPEDPIWPNRDRFVLSIGHASMLLYSMLHLTGVRAVNADYERLGEPTVTLDDIKRFRQLDSKCPGHPEYHWTSGVETTTGPPCGRPHALNQDAAPLRGRARPRTRGPGRTQPSPWRPRARHGLDPERARAVQDPAVRLGLLIFSDYMKPPIRLAALMELPVIYVFMHGSIGVGEDGPTHQPVEQLIALRAIPGLITLRPADANEVAEAWRVIAQLKHQPACLILSRQALPTFDRTRYASASGLARGAYVMADAQDALPEVILIGTGSEVQLCVDVYEEVIREGIRARVVSMPSWELFEQQDQAYWDSVLPPQVVARVAVEQASVIGWDRYVGRFGATIGMHTFGSSAPLKDLQTKFGFTPEKVLAAAKDQLAKAKRQRA